MREHQSSTSPQKRQKLTDRDDWPQIKSRIAELLDGGTPLRKVPYLIVEEFGVNRWSVMTAINKGLAPRAATSRQEPKGNARSSGRLGKPRTVPPDEKRKTFRGSLCESCGGRLRYMDTGDCVACPAATGDID
jgi:hypothetical protein